MKTKQTYLNFIDEEKIGKRLFLAQRTQKDAKKREITETGRGLCELGVLGASKLEVIL
jgi:hypothetical protein